MADQQPVARNEKEANFLLRVHSGNGDAKALGRLLEEGKANTESRDNRGSTGLIQASRNGHVECLKLLLAATADVKAQNEDGYTGLICASENGNVECLKLLLAANADLNCQNTHGSTALACASLCGRAECLELLLAANADVNGQNPRSGCTGLLSASSSGHVECLKLLVAANANVDWQDRYGYTGLIYASMNGHVECLKLLLAARADVSARDVDGCTGLIEASKYGRAECVKLLVAANADVNYEDINGYTGLIHASGEPSLQCVAILLENKANVNHCGEGSRTALTVSEPLSFGSFHYGKLLTQFLLLSCGAQGDAERGKITLAAIRTRIIEYHTELKVVLEEKVIVDTRLYLEQNGLYHEPLERVMQYCGLELMLENDPNRDEDDPIPQLLRNRPERVRSALYWWYTLRPPREVPSTREKVA